MNWGAAQASGEVLLFLHADTRLPPDALSLIMEALSGTERCWGRFDVRLENSSWPYRVIESAMNWRSHLSGVVTGDQALFVTRAVFENLGGFAELPLMEDIELSKRLRRVTRPVRLRAPVRASSRRWEAHGLVRTILVMWWLRLLYFLGVDPDVLSRIYNKK